MRITKISVKKLFGVFDHEIPLNQESRITIIHGPNGVGKTVLLNLVQAFFSCNYAYFRSIPFEQFRVEIDKDKSVSVEYQSQPSALRVRFADSSGTAYEPICLNILQKDELTEAIGAHCGGLKRFEWRSEPYWVLADYDFYREDDEVWVPLAAAFTLNDVFSKSEGLHDEIYGETPQWFADIHEKMQVETIDTWRLGEKAPPEVTVSWSELNDRGVHKVPFDVSAMSSITGRINLLIESHLRGALFAREKAQELYGISNFVQEINAAASLVETAEKLEEDAQNMTYMPEILTFLDLANGRLLYKRLNFHYDEMDVWLRVFVDGNPLSSPSMEDLSSGEQNLISLYFQLLFLCPPGSLVMIDEPEISLNVVWQRNFLKDLERIIALRGFDVLIATHSPQIIHDKWDWMVALGEKVED